MVPEQLGQIEAPFQLCISADCTYAVGAERKAFGCGWRALGPVHRLVVRLVQELV